MALDHSQMQRHVINMFYSMIVVSHLQKYEYKKKMVEIALNNADRASANYEEQDTEK